MSDRNRKLPASKPRAAVIVTGMHRGGISAVAGTAIRLGLAPPRTMFAPAPMGGAVETIESAGVADLNRSLLRAAGCTWDDCLAFDPRTIGHAEQFGASCQSQRVLREEFGCASAFVMKGPELALTLPVWVPALRGAGASVSVLLVVRHPAEVARSLSRRDMLPESVTAPLWLHHMLEAERATRSVPRAIVLYEDLLRDWRWCMDWAGQCAGISWPTRTDGPLPHIDSFVTPSLRHHIALEKHANVGPAPVRELVDNAWMALRRLRDDVGSRSAQEVLDDVRSQFAVWRREAVTAATTRVVVDFVPRIALPSAYSRQDANWQQGKIAARPFNGIAVQQRRQDEFSERAKLHPVA
jgi:hypothetical protein